MLSLHIVRDRAEFYGQSCIRLDMTRTEQAQDSEIKQRRFRAQCLLVRETQAAETLASRRQNTQRGFERKKARGRTETRGL